MKTPQQIEDMFNQIEVSLCDHEPSLKKGLIAGATQMQKDLLESASGGFEEAWKNYRYSFNYGHKEALIFGWQACALSYEKKIQEKDAEIERLKKLTYVGGVFNCPKCKLRLTATTISMADGGFYENREPQQCSNGCGPMWMQTYKDEVKEARSGFNEIFDKYQEAVKDIDFLMSHASSEWIGSWKLEEIKTKYGLDKKEG